MTVDITPPIRSEVPDSEGIALLASSDPVDLLTAAPQGLHPQADVLAASDSEAALRRYRDDSQVSHELLTMFQARERDLRSQLEVALREIESGRGELAYLRQCQEVQQRSQQQLDQQLQARLHDLQQELTLARQELVERSGDVEDLRQRNAELVEQRDLADAQAMDRVRTLELDLAAIRQQLSEEQAAAEALRQRNGELEQRGEAAEQAQLQARASADGLEQALAAVRRESQEAHATADGLRQRSAELELELSTARRTLSQVASPVLLQQERDALLERVAQLQEELEDLQAHVGDAAPDRSVRSIREQQLKQDRGRLEEELESLHRLLEDLPEIFENKFRQRLQLVLDQQRRLLADNQMLREHLYALQPATPATEAAGPRVRLLPPADALPDDRPHRPGTLHRWLSSVLRRSRERSPEPAQTPESAPAEATQDLHELSDPDDGQPRAA
jgi:chromosome segregation ATPase